MIQTQQQKRAKHALAKVLEWKSAKNDKEQGELRSYASGLPMMIHTNGLGQAAAFYRSKADNSMHRELYNLLSNWLTTPGNPYADETDLLHAITSRDMRQYLAAQAEAMAYMDWVRKFARAFLKEEAADNGANAEQEREHS